MIFFLDKYLSQILVSGAFKIIGLIYYLVNQAFGNTLSSLIRLVIIQTKLGSHSVECCSRKNELGNNRIDRVWMPSAGRFRFS